ncbi:MAG: hypothetical protein KJN62_03485, partial [Deltaproteobacteria bacterium]|nr:hypothetical protein [Deltaproteobacteria bacterium]
LLFNVKDGFMMEILIVEDNLDLSLNIAESPTRWGHNSEHVMRDKDALKKQERRVSIVCSFFTRLQGL